MSSHETEPGATAREMARETGEPITRVLVTGATTPLGVAIV